MDRKPGALAVIPGILALLAVAWLFVQDAVPRLFEARSHAVLASFSLAGIAFACLTHQFARRREPGELPKAILLAAAFLFWAATQLWPSLPEAALFNDLAVGLFVLDVFLAIAGRPAARKKAPVSGDRARNAGRRGGRCCCCGQWPAQSGGCM